MKFMTPVELPECCVQLKPSTRAVFIGSCFAERMGQRLQQCLPASHIAVNPNGVLYNPGSIYNALIDLVSPGIDQPSPLLFEGDDGLWHHWHFATLYCHAQRNELWRMLQQRLKQARQVLEQADLLVITFSTDHAYYLAQGPLQGTLVANCHKQPASTFTEQVLDPEELATMWHLLLHNLQQFNPKIQIIFTLSPYRYVKYGLMENARSKARQLLLIDNLCRNHPNVSYFPAYEIITDELRDYRFYEADLIHPSEQAIDYVWERFTQWAFTPELQLYASERSRLLNDLKHRPRHPESEESRRFKAKVEERKKLFEKKWGESLDSPILWD